MPYFSILTFFVSATLQQTIQKKDLLISDICISTKHPCLIETFDCSPQFYATSISLLKSIKELLSIITTSTYSESNSFKTFPGLLSSVLIPKASSNWDSSESPDFSTYREKGVVFAAGWCASYQNLNQYIQQGSSIPFQFEKMIISGRYTLPHWISSFKLSYSLDGINWISYQNSTVFKANFEEKEPYEMPLTPFVARAVKIFITDFNQYPGGRFEFFVSRHFYNNLLPSGSTIAAVSAGFKLTSSSVFYNSCGVFRAGFDSQQPGIGAGAWCAGLNDGNQWIMVTGVKLYKWIKIGTIGDSKYDQWITSYYIMYSSDGINWQGYKNNYVFTGNNDRNTMVEYDIEPFIAYSVRIRPLTWYGWTCARVEFYCVEI